LHVACPITPLAAEAPAEAEREADRSTILEAPRPRVIRPGGRRADEHLPALVDHVTRPLAVGAPIVPATPTETTHADVPTRVLTLAAPGILATLGESDQRDRLRLRARSLGVPFLHLPPALPPECAGALPVELARELRAVPVGRTETALTVALDTRWDARLLFRLRAATGLEIFPVLTLPDELDRALGQFRRQS
jgi:hypothetical protein